MSAYDSTLKISRARRRDVLSVGRRRGGIFRKQWTRRQIHRASRERYAGETENACDYLVK